MTKPKHTPGLASVVRSMLPSPAWEHTYARPVDGQAQYRGDHDASLAIESERKRGDNGIQKRRESTVAHGSAAFDMNGEKNTTGGDESSATEQGCVKLGSAEKSGSQAVTLPGPNSKQSESETEFAFTAKAEFALCATTLATREDSTISSHALTAEDTQRRTSCCAVAHAMLANQDEAQAKGEA